jgi:hypothetical protein
MELRLLTGPLSSLQMIKSGGIILTGENSRTRRKPCRNATLSTTSPTWIALGANPSLCGEKPVTNRLNNDTASSCSLQFTYSHLYVKDGCLLGCSAV